MLCNKNIIIHINVATKPSRPLTIYFLSRNISRSIARPYICLVLINIRTLVQADNKCSIRFSLTDYSTIVILSIFIQLIRYIKFYNIVYFAFFSFLNILVLGFCILFLSDEKKIACMRTLNSIIYFHLSKR